MNKDLPTIISDLNKLLEGKPWGLADRLSAYVKVLESLKGQPKQRTVSQNNAIHLFCKMLAESLNLAGLEMKVVLKPSYMLWWDTLSVKEHIWKPVQKAKFGKESTTELVKVGEIDAIHEQIMQMLGEKFGLEYIEFPHQEVNQTNYKQMADKIKIK
jgi:hypothetical protein